MLKMAIYKHSVPSREQIIVFMESKAVSVSLIEFYKSFNIKTKLNEKSLKRTLSRMVRDGQLKIDKSNKYHLLASPDTVIGKVSSHKDGYGFLVASDNSEDFYISRSLMRQLLDGDEVAVATSSSKRGKSVRSIVEIIKRSDKTIIGEFFRISNSIYITPKDTNHNNIRIDPKNTLGAKNGDLVEAKVTRHPTLHHDALAEVVRIIGRYDDPGINIKVAILSYGLPFEWSVDIEKEVKALPKSPSREDKKHRSDLTNLPFVTIDDEEAKDFDDAIYCEDKGDSWKLIVAIADVAHYVKHNSFSDHEAKIRGTSIYFPNQVIPMLHHYISNNLCSLRKNSIRLVLCCEIIFTKDGRVIKSSFFEGVIRSRARLTYNTVNDYINGLNTSLKSEISLQISLLKKLYLSLKEQRDKRRTFDFNTPNIKYIFDSDGAILDIKSVDRLISHRVVEECMIAANIEAAKYIMGANIPAPFRVHKAPDQANLDSFYLMLKSLSIDLNSIDKISEGNFNIILKSISDQVDETVLKDIVLRIMNRAEYKSRNIGHYGLALNQYTHFTSPIRRYPDLLVHRAIKYLVKHGNSKNYIYSNKEIQLMSIQASLNEKRADEATWKIEDDIKSIYIKRHIGKSFWGHITSVTKFGFFVKLSSFQIDGLVHISTLLDDDYSIDHIGAKLIGKKRKKTYSIGQKLKVKIMNISEDESKIYLLVDKKL